MNDAMAKWLTNSSMIIVAEKIKFWSEDAREEIRNFMFWEFKTYGPILRPKRLTEKVKEIREKYGLDNPERG